MADEGAARATEEEPQAEFDMEFVPHLPDGRAIVPAEREGRFVFLVATGAMTRQCFDEMLHHLQAIVGSGRWRQNWEPARPAEVEPPATVAEFGMEIRPNLPDGAAILPDEQPGRFVWLVAAGAMTRQCFDEMRGYLLHIVGSGEWTQDWSGGPSPQPGR
ncbi:hypothetical protein OG746_26980 [Streptomyces sp. NBC_01016]|uniref:hypothetical protein n=1 Tax=Streptomyces sp. NBC_01016 TaxID=2903720 RepID=UPI00225655BC|nr:hypothetical protein [Streptomyces sp. NBC_01016]MCX4827124.1 hypothetical protein [Streptomyces sp. NBC_01016]MCX4832387.1 hypothetical protein [Streptomyces sp. NBC_01016]